MNKKLIISLALASLAFTGCLSFDGGGTDTNNNQGLPTDSSKNYDNGQVSLQYPSNWELIEPKDFTSEIPKETQVVIRNNIKNENFTANINVVKNDLQVEKSALDYAKEVLNRQKTGLLDYKETKREIITAVMGGSSQETYYVEFEARLNPSDPITKHFQTYGVKGQFGYIILGSASTAENSAVLDVLQTVVKGFKVN